MKDNKGFTLVELLGVLVILIIIFLIGYPAIASLINEANSGIETATQELIFDSTNDFLDDNDDIYIANADNTYCISIEELIDYGLLNDNELKNLDEKYKTVKVTYDKSGKASYELVEENACTSVVKGARLALVGKSSIKINLQNDGAKKDYVEPGLYFYDGESDTPTKLTFDIYNPSISGLSIISTSQKTNETYGCSSITNCISQLSIDSYKVKYSYEAADGKTYVAERLIKVVDNEAPVITIDNPDETIFVSNKTFDVNDGVSATDNSGEKITVTSKSNVTLGTKGTYLITYTATDSSGNTSTVTKKLSIVRPQYILQNVSSGSKFRESSISDTIIEIRFVDYIKIPDGAQNWDVSDKQDGTIMAWLEPASEGSSWNILYYGSEGDIYAPTNSSNLLSNYAQALKINLDNFYTDNVTDMSFMFYGNYGLTSLDVSNFDTSNVTDMSYMFMAGENMYAMIDKINGIEYFDTAKVINMSFLFCMQVGLTNLDLSRWDTSSVTDMSWMFAGDISLTKLNVSNFDTSSVTNMYGMFAILMQLQTLDISNFDTSKVTNMMAMFMGDEKITSLDVSKFNTSKVSDMSSMFDGCAGLTSLDLSNFDTGNVTDMSWMFDGCTGLTSLDLSNFDTGNVTNMEGMFSDISSLTSLDLSNFDTSNVTDMGEMFYGCAGLTSLDLSSFDTGKVTDMSFMFSGDYDSDSKVLTLMNLAEIKGIEKINTSNVTDMDSMFRGNAKLASLDLSNFDTSNVTNMSYMFYGCFGLISLKLSNWDTGKVTDMSWMFGTYYDSKNKVEHYMNLAEIKGIENFDTSNVTDMSHMFYGCTGLTVLDLSNFDTSKVTDMRRMFLNCKSLVTIYASDNLVVTNVSNDENMFLNCSKLKGAISYDSSKVTKEYANYTTGYFTLKS